MKKRTGLSIALWVMTAFASSAAVAEEVKTIQLSVGHQKVISEHEISRIEYSYPPVVEIRDVGNSVVLLSAFREGETTLVISKKSGQQVRYQISVDRPWKRSQPSIDGGSDGN